MNILQLEQILYNAFTEKLGTAAIKREYGGTKLAFELEGDDLRETPQIVTIIVNVETATMCEKCNDIILFPDYKQTMHKVCNNG